MQSIRPTSDDEVALLQELLTTLGRRNSLRDPIAAVLEGAGLTPAQVHAVLWLSKESKLTMGELAQRLGVTDKTITGIVDRLERAGYLARERSSKDRRQVAVVLRPKGKTLAVRMEKVIAEKMGEFLGLLSAQDRKALFRILQNLVNTVEKASRPL